MNIVYRVVWNSATGTWVVASEVAKGRKKKSVSKNVMAASASAMALNVLMVSNPVAASDLSDLSKYITISGNSVSTASTNSIAIGSGASATSTQSIAMGINANASNQFAVAIGQQSAASGMNSIAMGVSAQAKGTASAALGDNSLASGASATAVGNYSVASGEYSSAFGRSAEASGNRSVALGQATASGDSAIAIGRIAAATGSNSTAVGQGSSAEGQEATAFGSTSRAIGLGATALGSDARADGENAVALGRGSSAASANGIALGYNASGTGTNSVALGTNTTVAQLNSVALGANAMTTVAGAVALGADSKATQADTVSVGNDALKRRVTNMAAGTAGTDAVNLDQLKGLAQSTASALGGGSTVNAAGAISKPTYTVNGAQVSGVDGAVNALESRITSSTDALKWDATSSTYTAKHGTAATSRISNVSTGVADTDAVNTKQLTDAITSIPNNPLAVSFTSNAKDEVALNGAKISGLAAGKDDADAVNVKQLKDAGVIDGSGNAAELVAYAPGSNKGEITLAGAGGTQIHNVKDGSNATDAVNKGQLDGAVKTITDATSDIAPKLRYLKFGSSTALDATANGSNSVALGGNAFAQGDNAVAIGLNSNATNNAVAVGFGSQATEINTFSVGSKTSKRRIVNVADGTAASDAATVGQVDKKILDAMSVSSQATQTAGVASPTGRSAKTMNVAATQSLLAAQSLAPEELIVSGPTNKGGQIEATGVDSLAMGLNSHAKADYAVAAGQNVTVTAAEGVGVGQNVVVNGKQGVAIGSQANVYADNAVAIGSGGTYVDTGATGGVAIGQDTAVGGVDTVAIGSHALAVGTNNVVLGANSTDGSRNSVVSVGDAGSERQIINVKAGTVDTDAVNVGQLKGSAKSVADALGGGAVVDATGKITKPKYTVNGTDVTGVDGAISALDNRATAIAGDALSWDATSGTYSATHGTTTENRISNVAAGTADSDAVNKKQLTDAISLIPNNPLAVSYTSNAKDEVALGDAKISGLAAGTDDSDAVNLKQLKDAGLIDGSGNSLNAVVYDDATKGKITFNEGGAATTLSNVAAGSGDTDAVNVKQLKDAGLIDGTGTTQKAVLFNGPAGEANAQGQKLVNLAAGSDDTDAVNVKQLKDAGLIDGSGTSLNAVVYDDATKDTVTLNKGGAATTLSNVAAGSGDTDAVNVKQLKDAGLIDGTGATQKAVLFNGPAGEANAQGQKLVNLAAGSDDTDAVNVKQLKDAGLIDGSGTSLNAVVYDDATKDTVTLNKGGAAVSLTNVAEASGRTDAVNLGQLQDAGVFDAAGNALAVSYDDATKGKITFNEGGAATTLSNVAAGSGDTDAVNVKQLKDAGLIDGTGTTQKAVLFNGPAGEANAQGQKLVNLAAGTDDTDAVNKKQLTDAISSIPGNPLAVSYDDNAKGKVTFNQGGAATTLSNVAAGAGDTDAVNVKQLKDAGLIDGTGTTQKAVLFNGPAGEANAQGQKLVNLAAGSADADAVNVKQLKDAGILDGSGNALEAVTYVPGSDKGEINLAGVDGTQIHNVKDGSDAQDAVNKGQLDGAVKDIRDATADIAPKLKYIKFGVTNAPDATATGTDSVAIGGNAFAQGQGTLAIGANANAGAANAVAIGFGSQATEANTFAVGSRTNKRQVVNVADGTRDSDAATVGQVSKQIQAAIGTTTTVMSANARSLSISPMAATSSLTPDELIISGPTNKGGQLAATGTDSLAMGLNSQAKADYAVAAGQNVVVTGEEGVGVGQKVVVNGKQGVAIGSQTSVFADNAVAIGSGGTYVAPGADRGLAIGFNTAVGGVDTLAIGNDALATGAGSVVLGSGSTDDGRDKVVSVGAVGEERRIVNVATGIDGTDAVNVQQLKDAGIIDGNGNSVKAVLFDGLHGEANAQSQKLINLADGTDTSDAVNKGQLDTAIASVNGLVNPLAVSYTSSNKDQIEVGDGAGGTAKISGLTAGTDDTDAVNVKQLKDAGIIDGSGQTLNAVVYDAADKAKVTFGGATGSVLDNVAAGQVSASSMQAINGSQLYGASQSVADALGGGSAVDAAGKISKPTYTVGGTNVTGVADAVSALDGRITGMGTAGDALNWDAASQTYSASHAGQASSRISNVADAVDTADAVNKGQLDKALQGVVSGNNPLAVSYDDGNMDSLTLGGAAAKAAGKAVKLKNVAAATEDDEAVNLAQLKDAGLVDAATGTTLDAVVYDANSNKATVTFGGQQGTLLTNVADGRIESGSRDAVNGGQIAALRDSLQSTVTNIDARVTNIENTSVGGGTGSPIYIAANGTPQAASAADAGQSAGVAVGYNTVASGEGASAIGDGATAAGADSVAVGNNAAVTAAGTNSVALGNNSVADTANTVSVGSASNQRTISNVANGTADTDAATMGQMRDTLTQANAYTDSRLDDVWNDLGNEISRVNRQANRGIAAASALINVTPYVPGHVTVNAGVANYRGESALGVGVSRWSDNGRVNVNAGVSAAQGDKPIVRVGIGLIF
jgi:autotransporter adhesin